MADTNGGYAHWIRATATDSQIVGIRDQRDRLNKDYAALRRAFAWYIRQDIVERTGTDALTEETISMMIDDYVETQSDVVGNT